MAKDVDFIGVLKNLIPILQNHAEVAGLVFFGDWKIFIHLFRWRSPMVKFYIN